MKLRLFALLAVLFLASPASAELLLTLPISTAGSQTSTPPYEVRTGRPYAIVLQGNFIYGSGGTTVDAYVQTTLDGGMTWFDIANFHFTTSSKTFMFSLSSLTAVATENAARTDGSMAANTALDGFIGPLYRVKYVTTGTYAGGTTLQIDIVPVGEN